MDIIQLLPDSVANQIAAGEVIQRPASVIKELVENSVDAGATLINVLVEEAGRTSIQVIDNGKGMSDTDARLSFERHSTSKIRKADDLFALRTMGFRGEALASIAAVAQVELKTKQRGEDLGTHLSIAGSRVLSQQPTSCPEGSNFLVSNLFYNVPARRKFLKTNATELNNIMTAYERIVLVYPEIGFTLHSNGSELMNLKAGTLHQRIADVFGKRLSEALLPMDTETTLCKITGFVGKPESARKKGAQQYFFVNGRYMKHPYFHKAVMSAFERIVQDGMQVPYFIYFEVDPANIDVNIHPTKTEIKFDEEQAIWQILRATVNDAIGKFCNVTSIDFDTDDMPDIPAYTPGLELEMPQLSTNPDFNPFKSHPSHYDAPKRAKGWESLFPDYDLSHLDDTNKTLNDETYQEFLPLQWEAGDGVSENLSPLRGGAGGGLGPYFQYKALYLMASMPQGLMIIDQHRADIRIRYERYMRQIESGKIESQRVLFPEVIEFSASDAPVLERIMPELNNLGFDLTDLGQHSYAINGVPAGTDGMDYVTLLQNMIAQAAEQPTSIAKEVFGSLALVLARESALPYGEVLTNTDMEDIINRLFACSNVNHTPDGQPIINIIKHEDIVSMF